MAKLDLLVDVNVNGANKINSLGKSIAGGAIQVAKFALPVAGAIAGVTALAATAEKSQVKLEAAFKNMGSTSGKSLKQLEDQATDLGEKLTFDDEDIKEAQAALLSFGAVGGKAFDRAIEGAADYAAATGKDLTSATTTLGKALADPEKGLARLTRAGIVFTEQQEEQVKALTKAGDVAGAQEVILGAFEDRYKGVNEALSESSAGQAAQAMEDLQNAGEDLGAIFLPILAALAQGVSAFAHFVQDNMGTIRPIIETIGQVIATVFGGIVSVIQGFTSGGTGDAFAGVWRVIGQAVDFVSKQVFPFLLQIFQQVVAFIRENGPTIGSIVSQAFGAIVAVAKVVVPILMNIAKVVFPILLTAAGILLKGLDGTFKLIGGVFNVAAKVVDVMVKSITTAWQLLSTITTAIWTGITNTIKGVFNAVADVINGFFGFLNGLSFGIGPFDVGPVHIDAATFDPFNIPLIPHLAQGGIISSPTLALLGEAGPEAVVPLGSGGKLGGDVHYHVDVRGEEPFIRNETDLTRTLQRTAFLAGF
jgi:phage-related protein